MSGTVRFEVVGLPAPQGSKTRMPNGAMVEGKSAGQRVRHRSWRDSVTTAAREASVNLSESMDGPLALTVEFRFPMPKSRPKAVREAGVAWKQSMPDLDKLVRSTGDALTVAGLVVDDARFAVVKAWKVEVVGWTGATITVEPVRPTLPEVTS